MPAIIAAFLAAMSRLLSSRVGAYALSALGFIGLSVATQTFAVTPLLDQIIAYAGATGDAIQWLSFFNFDKAITILASAVTVKYSMQAGKAFFKKV